MKLPNWFRVAWWAVLTAGIAAYLALRFSDLAYGEGTAFDAVVLILWVGLLLVPVTSEFNLLGIFTIKQEMDSLRAHVDREVNSLRNEVHSVVGVSSQVNPQFHFASLVPESQLTQYQEAVRVTVREVLESHGLRENAAPSPDATIDQVDRETTFMFAARYLLESEIQRAYNRVTAGYVRPSRTAMQKARILLDNSVIDEKLFEAIAEVYAVCSAGIHGHPVTPARVAFVRETGPGLVRALRVITETTG